MSDLDGLGALELGGLGLAAVGVGFASALVVAAALFGGGGLVCFVAAFGVAFGGLGVFGFGHSWGVIVCERVGLLWRL